MLIDINIKSYIINSAIDVRVNFLNNRDFENVEIKS